ncbi:MAG TPA: nucleotide exchange factor GrpE [Gaiellaceae bacterium]|nr:nucleotide exchange factor GrpE [Gaiellaceae bacterium]
MTQRNEGVESVEADSTQLDDERVAALEAERDEYLGLLQRVQADFENYRKRAARDQERLVAHAHERLVRELLPVLDDLGRALEAAERHEEAAKPPVRESGPVEGVQGNREVPPAESETLRSLLDGVKLVERSLRAALEKEGLVEIETNGAFDPHVHEAVLAQPREDAEPGAVVDVLQRGYRLGDKVVRPARVIVAE